MVITREISVDVAKRNVFSAIVAKQLDNNSRFLKVTITNLGEKLSVAATSTVVINALREDGLSKAFLGEANDDGTVTVPLTLWMLELDGEVKCDISVVGTEDRKLTTMTFILAVEAANYSGDEIADDENYDLLISLLSEVAECKTAEAERVANENTRISNETTRQSNETTRKSNETSRKSAETARGTAEKARADAETERASAEDTRKANEEARQAAETLRQTNTANAIEKTEAATQAALAVVGQVSLENRDEGKQYTYKLFVENGYPGIELTEITE